MMTMMMISKKTYLTPKKSTDTKKQTPYPLVETEAGSRKGQSTKLYENDLTANTRGNYY